jgi:pimeloyl-ACP methyl ester carboxylesterase
MKRRKRVMRIAARGLALGLLSTGLAAHAGKPRMIELPSGAQVVYQPTEAPEHRYAPVVLLPYTGGSAQDLYRWKYSGYFSKHSRQDIVLILPPEEGDFDDYETGEDWAETVAEWEEELRETLDEASERLPLDRDRIVLAGHSMGGDMAWALMQRRPDRYAGAVIMGSRCNWREYGSPQKLSQRAVRVAFSVGQKEKEVRRKGAQLARGLLEKFGVLVRWDDTPGGHVPAPGKLFSEQIDFVLAKLPQPVMLKTASTGPAAQHPSNRHKAPAQ